MPGAKSPVSQEDFYTVLTGHVKRCAPFTKGSAVGFCFSYAATITPERDGRVITIDKEVVVNGCEGQLIGASLIAELERRGMLLSMCLGDNARQIAQFATVLQECPRLKVAIGHFGLARSRHWIDQVRLARAENVRIESGGITWLYNDEFYPFPGAVRAIRQAADEVGIVDGDGVGGVGVDGGPVVAVEEAAQQAAAFSLFGMRLRLRISMVPVKVSS